VPGGNIQVSGVAEGVEGERPKTEGMFSRLKLGKTRDIEGERAGVGASKKENRRIQGKTKSFKGRRRGNGVRSPGPKKKKEKISARQHQQK